MLNREQVRGVYAEAAALPASEVSAFLDRACGEDVELRREVESLLASAAKRPGFLGAPTTPMGPGLDVPGERVGMMLGRYRLVEEIGQGGFGTVYVAEQVDPVRRLVALKIIKLGMDTRAVVARFESERQALALMDHPHIARVFDAGASESGRPYFVMELVKGEPITEYADRAELSIDERVDLFVQVCQAVQHAHTKGVIHRDIKPGNVLVATQDGTPHAKVIDFGIAKATQSRLTERTVFTEFRQLVGTPEYMSPEQAGGASDVDTRSDVYGLGATLYELLTGVPPFEPGRLRQAAYEEMRRIIRETEPERPSTRLSRLSVRGDALTRGRRVPRGFGALVLGDLDWIVMKSLEKDRARRYQTAGALAEDLRRHRTGEPVLAAPPSTAYRLRKFAKRHQKLVLATCAVAGALILGIIGTSVGLVMANAARAASDAHASRAEIEAARATRAEEDAVRDRIAAEYEGYIANIESAYGALRADDSTRLRMRLAACPQERRNWEWRFLSAASDGSVRALTHPRQNVQWARFSHDASRLVTTSGDGKVRLWNPESGVEIAAFQGPEVFWGEVDFSPDDTMIVSAANDGRVWVWDTVARKEVVQFGGHTKRVMHAWFVDGARVLSVSKDGTARVWSSRTGDHSAVLEHDGPITAAAFFRAGPLVATASVKVGVRIWSLDKAEPMRLNGQDGMVMALRWSPDGERLVSASHDGSVVVWDRRSGLTIARFKHDAGAIAAGFSPDGTRVVTTAFSGPPRVWDIASGRMVLELEGHTNVPLGARFSPDGESILTNSRDNTVRLWDAQSGVERMCFRGHVETPWVAEFCPDGEHVMTGGDTTVRFWRMGRDPLQSVVRTPMADPAFMRLSADQRTVLESGDGRIRLIDVETGAERRLGGADIVGAGCAISPDGARVVAQTESGVLRSWMVATGVEERVFAEQSENLNCVEFRPDGERFVSAGSLGTARVWAARTGEELLTLQGHTQGVYAAAYSPSGTRIVTGSADKTVRVWDAESGLLLRTLKGHQSDVLHVCFSVDGRRILSSSNDYTARIWNEATGEQELLLEGHELSILDGCFSADGTRIVTGSLDGTVRIWDAATGRQILSMRNKSGGVHTARFSADGKRLFYADTDGRAWLLDSLPARERSASPPAP